jgi:hypothetical protein
VPDPQHLHIPQHGEGPAARHAGPFAALQVPFLPAAEVRPLYQDYVIPFYNHNLSEFGAAEEAAFSRIRNSISDDLITTLLSDYNWRSRTTATYFALILDRPQHLQHIGKLLLRSDVCFAGAVYCRYLAYLRTPEAIEFLNLYLAFYLTRTQRYFDQHQALAALRHIDKLTGSRHEASHAAAVQLMVEARPDFLNHVSEDRLAGDLRSAARMRG